MASAAAIGTADAFDISDDGSLIWLTDPSLTPGVVATLSKPANQQALGIQEKTLPADPCTTNSTTREPIRARLTSS